ncbi:MAG: hypothetical protein MdMp014T_0377 [Treponematales bacterium]
MGEHYERHAHHDFLPDADGPLLVYAQNYLAAFAPIAAAVWGFSADETAALTAAVSAYETALEAAANKGRDRVAAKNAARAALKRLLRAYTARIQAHPATTDSHRAALNITIRAKHPSRIETPVVYPHILLETAGYLTVKVTFYFDNPEHLGIPHGFLGAVLFFHIGDEAVTDFAALNRSQMMSESPYLLRLPQEADLKTLSCSAAWEVSGGRQGPMAPVQSVRVR